MAVSSIGSRAPVKQSKRPESTRDPERGAEGFTNKVQKDIIRQKAKAERLVKLNGGTTDSGTRKIVTSRSNVPLYDKNGEKIGTLREGTIAKVTARVVDKRGTDFYEVRVFVPTKTGKNVEVEGRIRSELKDIKDIYALQNIAAQDANGRYNSSFRKDPKNYKEHRVQPGENVEYIKQKYCLNDAQRRRFDEDNAWHLATDRGKPITVNPGDCVYIAIV